MKEDAPYDGRSSGGRRRRSFWRWQCSLRDAGIESSQIAEAPTRTVPAEDKAEAAENHFRQAVSRVEAQRKFGDRSLGGK